jgi:adenylate cyclase
VWTVLLEIPMMSAVDSGQTMDTDERRLVAIFAADVAGYSRLMRADEQGTMRAL